MTLTLFKTYVKQDFKRTDKDTELVQAYNDMIQWVASQMPHGGYKFQSFINTTDGTEDYALPSNLVHLIHPIKLILGTGDSDEGYELEHLTKNEYDIREPNPNRGNPPKGRPSAYCVFSRSILVTPLPDRSTYIFEIDWAKRAPALSADSDVSSLGSEWDEVLKHGTLERLYAGMGLTEEAIFFGSKYHQLDASGNDIPVGLCKRLFDIETDRESKAVGQVLNNDL